jgi:hypothetical protein
MRRKHILLSFVSLIFLTGCANQQLTNSGHIENIDNLTEVETSKVERHKKIESFVIADATSRTFDHLAIGRVKFDLPDDVAKKLKPKDQKKLTDYFEKSLREELKDFPILDKIDIVPPKTYFVDIVVTDINGSNAPLNFILTATIALPFDTGGITTEARITDVDTGEEVAAFRGYREGTMFHIIGGMTKYGHAEGGINFYSTEIKKLLNNFNCPNCKAGDKTPKAIEKTALNK